jgi:hypothetical protein
MYIKATDTNSISGNYLHDTLHVDMICVRSELTLSPYAMGDAKTSVPNAMGDTDFALYGASHVGMLGAVVETTDVDYILQLDCLATDYYHDDAWPTYLYYNPYDQEQLVTISLGDGCHDIYDTVSQTFISVDAFGDVQVPVPADNAVVAVICPSKADITIEGAKKRINGVIIDYRASVSGDCEQLAASPDRLPADINLDCSVDIIDLKLLAGQWLDTQSKCAPADINLDQSVDIKDYTAIFDWWLDKIAD